MERIAETEGVRGVVKPPYAIPSLAAIRATPTHGRTVVSLFAGAGGSSTGYRLAGFRILRVNEFVPEAAAVYAANYPETPIDPRDIRTVAGPELLAATGLARGELDVLDGSPPCSAFSSAGKRAKLWGSAHAYSTTRQRVDDLFAEYLRLVDALRPRVAIAENVAGLVAGAGKGVFKQILRRFQELGYVVGAQKLDAQWLGVPQRRQRILVVAVRRDLGRAPAFPRPLPYRYSVAEAFATLPPDAPIEPETNLDAMAIGRAARHLVAGGQSKRYFSLILADPREPAPTITATQHPGTAAPIHWERRRFSLAELRRLCGFPDDYQFPGKYTYGAERLGRAVPPPMMAALAGAVARDIFDV
jgi:DNA (cytosine-5)-methyltransferase 1